MAVNRPFTAHFPQPLRPKDEIIIKGKLKPNAEVFSVNFCVDCDNCTPSVIAYHFKTVLSSDEVVHNHKTGSWQTEIKEGNTWLSDPGDEFTLIFIYKGDYILVYTGDDNEGRNFQYRFDLQTDFEEVKCIQLWDDLEYIKEITFRFNN